MPSLPTWSNNLYVGFCDTCEACPRWGAWYKAALFVPQLRAQQARQERGGKIKVLDSGKPQLAQSPLHHLDSASAFSENWKLWLGTLREADLPKETTTGTWNFKQPPLHPRSISSHLIWPSAALRYQEHRSADQPNTEICSTWQRPLSARNTKSVSFKTLF